METLLLFSTSFLYPSSIDMAAKAAVVTAVAPVQPQSLDVELDFEFDKSEELYLAIEDAYSDVYSIIDMWKDEFNKDARISDQMYFSDFIHKRKEMYAENKTPTYVRLDSTQFMEWLNSKASGGYTALHQNLGSERAVEEETVKINIFSKVRHGYSVKQDIASGMRKAGAVTLAAPTRQGPSKLLQRLNVASSVLAFDYDNMFETFTEGWHEHDDAASDGEEPDVEELRRLHLSAAEQDEDSDASDEENEWEMEDEDEEDSRDVSPKAKEGVEDDNDSK